MQDDESADAVDASEYDGLNVTMAGIITAVKQVQTKKKQLMRFSTLEDKFGTIEVIAFPTQVEKYGELLTVDSTVVVEGKTSVKDEEGVKLIAEKITPLTKTTVILPPTENDKKKFNEPLKKQNLYLRLTPKQSVELSGTLSSILDKYEGNIPVTLCLVSDGQKTKYSRYAKGVKWCDALKKELEDLLLKQNVIIK